MYQQPNAKVFDISNEATTLVTNVTQQVVVENHYQVQTPLAVQGAPALMQSQPTVNNSVTEQLQSILTAAQSSGNIQNPPRSVIQAHAISGQQGIMAQNNQGQKKIYYVTVPSNQNKTAQILQRPVTQTISSNVPAALLQFQSPSSNVQPTQFVQGQRQVQFVGNAASTNVISSQPHQIFASAQGAKLDEGSLKLNRTQGKYVRMSKKQGTAKKTNSIVSGTSGMQLVNNASFSNNVAGREMTAKTPRMYKAPVQRIVNQQGGQFMQQQTVVLKRPHDAMHPPMLAPQQPTGPRTPVTQIISHSPGMVNMKSKQFMSMPLNQKHQHHNTPTHGASTTVHHYQTTHKLQQHKMISTTPASASSMVATTAVTTPTPPPQEITAAPEPIASNIMENSNLSAGAEYNLTYSDGRVIRAVFDGTHFVIQKDTDEKTPAEDPSEEKPNLATSGGGGGGSVKKLKGNATGLLMSNTPQQRGHDGSMGADGATPVGRRWSYSHGPATMGRNLQRPLQTNAEGTMQVQTTPQPQYVNKMTGQLVTRPIMRRTTFVKPFQSGKYAMCRNCGNSSKNYNICDSCQKELPDDVKYHIKEDEYAGPPPMKRPNTTTVVIQSPRHTLDKTQFYGTAGHVLSPALAAQLTTGKIHTTPVPGKRPAANRKRSEPVMVTISSDEEEMAMDEEEMYEGGEMEEEVPFSEAAAIVKPRPVVGQVTATSITAAQIVTQLLNRDKIEGADASAKGSKTIAAVTPNAMLPQRISLETRAIRIGNLKGQAYQPVSLSSSCIQINIETANDSFQVIIEAREVAGVQICFSPQMPVVFLQTSPGCSNRIRERLGMGNKDQDLYYDPFSRVEAQKRIVLLLKVMSTELKEKLVNIFQMIKQARPHAKDDFFQELPYDITNSILIGCASNPTSVMRYVMPAGSQLVQTPGGLQLHLNPECDDDEDIDDRSRSPSPPLSVFSGPIVKLFTYPPAPATGGIRVTNEDLYCLNDGEFLNDVIIDFYLKYIFREMMDEEDRKRTHIFSSFFYRRLTQRPKRGQSHDEDPKASPAERRHSRVQRWTRNVDLFEKDFIIVPINESAHWYLAVICFPGLDGPKHEDIRLPRLKPLQVKIEKAVMPSRSIEDTTETENDSSNVDKASQLAGDRQQDTQKQCANLENSANVQTNGKEEETKSAKDGSTESVQAEKQVNGEAGDDPQASSEQSSDSPGAVPKACDVQCVTVKESGIEVSASDSQCTIPATTDQDNNTELNQSPNEAAAQPNDDEDSKSSSQKDEAASPKDAAEKTLPTEQPDSSENNTSEKAASPAQPSSQSAENEESSVPEQSPDTKNDLGEKETVNAIKQPLILMFDSLAGPTRSGVIRIIREYLQVEWDAKKATEFGERAFDKDHIKGNNPKVPQQTNYSDCGVYVLDYVESFFKKPLATFSTPIKTLGDWFTEEEANEKRPQLRQLILDLQHQLNPTLDYDATKDIVL